MRKSVFSNTCGCPGRRRECAPSGPHRPEVLSARVLFEGYSSGSSRAQGPITKTGNGHARRLLVEAAWHHRPRYQPGKTIRDRWELASPDARARGDLGNRRLHARWVKYIDRKKKATVANTAIARELAGWCWSLALLEE